MKTSPLQYQNQVKIEFRSSESFVRPGGVTTVFLGVDHANGFSFGGQAAKRYCDGPGFGGAWMGGAPTLPRGPLDPYGTKIGPVLGSKASVVGDVFGRPFGVRMGGGP